MMKSEYIIELKKKGYLTFREDPTSDFVEIAARLGEPVTQTGLPLVTVLRSLEKDQARPRTFSAQFGYGEFPIHTDMAHWPVPPRYLVFRALTPTPDVPTLLIDSKDIRVEPSTLSKWERAVWQTVQVRRPHLCSMFFQYKGVQGIRWDPATMKPYGALAQSTLSEIISRLQETLNTRATALRWDSNDIVAVVDNWRMLHARPSVPYECRERILERVMLKESHYDK